MPDVLLAEGLAPSFWGALLGGATGTSTIVASLAWQLSRARKANAAEKQKNGELMDKLVVMRPLLAESSRVLQEVHVAMRATIDRARPGEADVVIRRLAALLSDTQRGRDDHDPPW